jgi:valyl-tRNA synthetase
MKVGGKLATKLLNVTKFVLNFECIEKSAPSSGPTNDQNSGVTELIDLAMLARLNAVVADATTAFEDLDYARALERTESFFWWFCDDYVELVKTRAYGRVSADGAPARAADCSPDELSARHALYRALSALQRLFAPHMPFCTDEVWSWWQDGSVHRAEWPTSTEQRGASKDSEILLDTASTVLSEIRRTKTEAKVSQRAKVSEVVVTCDASQAEAVANAHSDLVKAGSVAELSTISGSTLAVAVTLAQVS